MKTRGESEEGVANKEYQEQVEPGATIGQRSHLAGADTPGYHESIRAFFQQDNSDGPSDPAASSPVDAAASEPVPSSNAGSPKSICDATTFLSCKPFPGKLRVAASTDDRDIACDALFGGVGNMSLSPSAERAVVYCAHDAQFAEPFLRRFEQQTRIPLEIRFDTEADPSRWGGRVAPAGKPIGLKATCFGTTNFWGCSICKRLGCLPPIARYRIIAVFPIASKMPKVLGLVLLPVFVSIFPIKNKAPSLLRRSGWRLVLPQRKTQFAKAKPLYGTTRCHYTVLWQQWGAARLQAWHAATAASGARGGAWQCEW